jgi:uncharacterized membrane protein
MYTGPTRQQRQQGAISVLAAVALGVSITVAALALDLGHVFWLKRDLQKAADLASLSAVTSLSNATAIAQSIALANNFDYQNAATANNLTVTTGIYDWTTRAFAPGGAAESLNSVEVTVASTVPYFFLPGSKRVTATAIAARKEPTADFTADSFLAGIDPVLHAKLIASGYPLVDLGINVGIAGVTLQVIEPPVSASGPARCIDPAQCDSRVIGDWETRASTAQVRLGLMVRILFVNYTIGVEAAKMEAALTKIDCRSSPHSATILAKPGLLTVYSNGVPVLSSASAPSELTFTFTDPPPQTINVPPAGLGGLLGSVPVLGLVLGPIGSVLDGALAALGISLGGGDITVSQLNCNPPQLVR